LAEEFIQPLGLTQAVLAEAMGVQRKHVQRVVQRPQERDGGDGSHPGAYVRQQPGLLAERAARNDLWEVMNTPKERERIKRARPLQSVA